MHHILFLVALPYDDTKSVHICNAPHALHGTAAVEEGKGTCLAKPRTTVSISVGTILTTVLEIVPKIVLKIALRMVSVFNGASRQVMAASLGKSSRLRVSGFR